MLVVTGATGFLGSHLVCTLLRKGHVVLGLRRPDSSMSEFNQIAADYFGSDREELLSKLKWAEADLLDILSLDDVFMGADKVFHCAALVSFTGSSSLLHKHNAAGTANVVDACLRAGVRKLIYASSTAAIGRTDELKYISEQAQWYDDSNNTAYASSKHQAELEVWRGVEEGLDTVIVNPGIILGAGNWTKGSCRIFRKVFQGLSFYTNGINGFVGVKDVADIMSNLAFSETRNRRFILVAENLSYRAVFNMMAEGFGKKVPYIEIKKQYLPALIPFFLLMAKLFPKANLSAESLRTSLKQYNYDNTEIIKEGYGFMSVSEVIHEACMNYNRIYAKNTSNKSV